MTDTYRLLKFTSSRFGEVTIPEEKTIYVPDGIIGFPDFNRYAILDPSGGQSLFLWLQSVDEPELAFIITDPAAFLPDYSVDIAEPDLLRIDTAGKPPPALFVIVTVPRDNPDAVSANLKAPLLYFQDDATLHQVVLERADWPLRFPLLQPQERSGNPADEPRSSDETGEVD